MHGEPSVVHPKAPTFILPTQHRVDLQKKWFKYLSERQGTYEMRVPRYKAAGEKLVELGLTENHVLMDFGAGQTEFDYYLRRELDWRGYMNNRDGCLNGKDLSSYVANYWSHYVACLETIEHFDKPGEIIAKLEGGCMFGIVFTTPNPDVVDVKKMDDTHRSQVSVADWKQMHYETQVLSLYGTEDDGILAWKDMTK